MHGYVTPNIDADMIEVDVAKQKPNWAVKIKWSNKFFSNPGDLTSLSYFMNTNSMTEALVTSINETGTKEINKINLHFIPVACYAYTVGENTLNQTKSSYGL